MKFLNKLNLKGIAPLDDPFSLLKKTFDGFINGVEVSVRNYEFPDFIKDPDSITNEDVNNVEELLRYEKQMFINSNRKARVQIESKREELNEGIIKDPKTFLKEMLRSDQVLNDFFEQYCPVLGINNFNQSDGNKIIRETYAWHFYFCSFYLGLYHLAIKREGYSPSRNAGFCDILQTVYLSVCDYFVTDDAPLYELLKCLTDSEFIEIEKKVMKLDEFLSGI